MQSRKCFNKDTAVAGWKLLEGSRLLNFDKEIGRGEYELNQITREYNRYGVRQRLVACYDAERRSCSSDRPP